MISQHYFPYSEQAILSPVQTRSLPYSEAIALRTQGTLSLSVASGGRAEWSVKLCSHGPIRLHGGLGATPRESAARSVRRAGTGRASLPHGSMAQAHSISARRAGQIPAIPQPPRSDGECRRRCTLLHYRSPTARVPSGAHGGCQAPREARRSASPNSAVHCRASTHVMLRAMRVARRPSVGVDRTWPKQPRRTRPNGRRAALARPRHSETDACVAFRDALWTPHSLDNQNIAFSVFGVGVMRSLATLARDKADFGVVWELGWTDRTDAMQEWR